MSSGEQFPPPPTQDSDLRTARRWQLMAGLSTAVGSWSGDFPGLTGMVAGRIQQQICDGCMVVLLDPPGSTAPVIGFRHRSPEHEQLVRTAVTDQLGPAAVHAWVADVTGADGRMVRPPTRPQDPPEHWQQVLREHFVNVGLTDASYAPLRSADGAVRGMILCGRDPGSAGFDDTDLTTLAGAADSVSLGLDLLASRQEVTALAEQRRVLLAELLNAEQAERLRIAQEVHDDAIQLLAATQLRIQVLANQLPAGSPEGTEAGRVADLVLGVQRSLRQLLLDLEPVTGDDQPIEEALRDVADLFFADSGTTVTVTGALSDLPAEAAAVLYRAGREAVSNARRHAGAADVRVRLFEDDDQWHLSVDDDGIGIQHPIPQESGHLGLRGMRSRVEALGGSCVVGPRPGGGTRLTLSLPR